MVEGLAVWRMSRNQFLLIKVSYSELTLAILFLFEAKLNTPTWGIYSAKKFYIEFIKILCFGKKKKINLDVSVKFEHFDSVWIVKSLSYNWWKTYNLQFFLSFCSWDRKQFSIRVFKKKKNLMKTTSLTYPGYQLIKFPLILIF